ncbi:hypothetical protein [Acidomonas methanolica]|uniref:Uncharacterized protein n=1 Tax=Acidomonas methanolica NBRC 104435 TaxID=1231351 RepID=A0A023D291_ACIMT|nr:hypothetical protein [Acidomonas methanolica]MBU2655188.1 hypothetical protein [Acidomonas methanolica]TCS24715.1 hypothetical protein EDC31_12225 [Acidomonas methanolica]GAJ28242.1 hypothetical protein Amme_016_025 [Acidomonas methanolica NBRC 104435]GBQ50691.1 hypothetical protein AA0498_1272 [Acidomonas methanolica]GEK98765.1 hypothetical protein AME01nite_12640 [Acidomonas methanolica NBRC 104435]
MSAKRLIPPLLLASLVIIQLAHAPAALAQSGDDGGGAGANAPARVLKRVLAVLQVDPAAASDACVSALEELHKTQGIVTNDESDSSNSAKQELAVARDVLESDYDDTTEICGADARTLCRTKGNTLPKAAAPCQALLPAAPSP